MEKRTKIILAALVAAALLGAWYLGRRGPVEVNRREFGIMDTVITARVYAESREEGEEALDSIFSLMEELEKELSRYIPGSPVDEINRRAGLEGVEVPESVLFVVQRALEIAGETRGTFDITVGPLIDLWAIGTDRARVPEPGEIEAVLELVDYTAVQVDPASGSIFLPRERMALDLGGVAKGYIVDRCAAALKEWGVSGAYLDAGGDVRVLGVKPDGTPWRIGIRHPRERTKIFAVLPLETDLAVVTSGDYQRYFEVGEERYHHILDPETGYPAQSGVASVTVIAPDTISADILSTAFFVLGLEESLRIAEGMPGVEAFIITGDLVYYMTSGIQDIVEIYVENVEEDD